MDITNLKIAKNWYCKVVEKGLNWVRVQARGRACARFAKKNRTQDWMRFFGMRPTCRTSCITQQPQ